MSPTPSLCSFSLGWGLLRTVGLRVPPQGSCEGRGLWPTWAVCGLLGTKARDCSCPWLTCPGWAMALGCLPPMHCSGEFQTPHAGGGVRRPRAVAPRNACHLLAGLSQAYVVYPHARTATLVKGAVGDAPGSPGPSSPDFGEGVSAQPQQGYCQALLPTCGKAPTAIHTSKLVPVSLPPPNGLVFFFFKKILSVLKAGWGWGKIFCLMVPTAHTATASPGPG